MLFVSRETCADLVDLGMLTLAMGMLFAVAMTYFLAVFAGLILVLHRVRRLRVTRGHPRPVLEGDPEGDLHPVPRGAITQTPREISSTKAPDFRFMGPRPHDASLPGDAAESVVSVGDSAEPLSLLQRRQRLDWAYFNKDLGDLSDPYEPAPRRTTTGLVHHREA